MEKTKNNTRSVGERLKYLENVVGLINNLIGKQANSENEGAVSKIQIKNKNETIELSSKEVGGVRIDKAIRIKFLDDDNDTGEENQGGE